MTAVSRRASWATLRPPAPADVAAVPLVYETTQYPNFFVESNGDAVIDEVDGKAVAFNAWTPRSLRTAYNWKLVTADPGNYAHNPQYALELLFDSIEDLSDPLGTDMENPGLLR
jgi:hypothetical protein